MIDGDLRRPSVHKRFGMTNTLGLSNVLLNDLPWREALLTPEGIPDLDILPAGSVSRRAADLMGSGLQRLLDECSSHYDLIILDAPPLLGFPSRCKWRRPSTASSSWRAPGRPAAVESRACSPRCAGCAPTWSGWCLNEVHREISDSYYYYGYYGKYYKHYNGRKKEQRRRK